MSQPARRRVAAAQSAGILEEKLRIFRGDLTVADAAAKGGLALRDAEAALFHLSSQYQGHLKATSEGEVLFSFPQGFRKKEEGVLVRGVKAVGRAIAGVGRFIIRAWVSVVLVGYALILLAVLLAMAAKDDGDGAGEALVIVLRIIAEALFWTFHPFSPVGLFDYAPTNAYYRTRGQPKKKKVPFYEKVNRFVFGPSPVKVNEEARERLLVAEIRRLDGRLGPGDVLRVVGGTRAEAEALLCRLVLDYEGELEVSEEGAVVYKFAALRRTALVAGEAPAPPPIWTQREKEPKVTGNGVGTNIFLGALNGFNLTVGGVALANGLTIERIFQIISERANDLTVATAPIATGFPLFLGAIPFTFSAALFALPAARLVTHRRKVRRVAAENGRRGLLAAVVGRDTPQVVEAGEVRRAWLSSGGPPVGEAELTEEVRMVGGEPDVEDGKLVYRFEDLHRESRALSTQRQSASPAERSVGEVLFSSQAPPDES